MDQMSNQYIPSGSLSGVSVVGSGGAARASLTEMKERAQGNLAIAKEIAKLLAEVRDGVCGSMPRSAEKPSGAPITGGGALPQVQNIIGETNATLNQALQELQSFRAALFPEQGALTRERA